MREILNALQNQELDENKLSSVNEVAIPDKHFLNLIWGPSAELKPKDKDAVRTILRHIQVAASPFGRSYEGEEVQSPGFKKYKTRVIKSIHDYLKQLRKIQKDSGVVEEQ